MGVMVTDGGPHTFGHILYNENGSKKTFSNWGGLCVMILLGVADEGRRLMWLQQPKAFQCSHVLCTEKQRLL